MKKNKVFLMAVFLVFSLSSFGQRTCGSHEHFLEQLEKNPRFKERIAQIEKHTRNIGGFQQKAISGNISIPVHVIVVYANASQNISDAQIQSQISVLNEDYRKLNSDWTSTPSDFYNLVADAEIEFTLQAIERHADSRTSWGTNDLVKSTYPPYLPNTHLNVWLCNIGGGILGYAQFPGGSASTDGIVISPQYFGSSDYNDGSFYLSAPFDKGRTATHEVGHWLNLRHIWGDGPCGYTDYVSDTPDAEDANYGCPSHPHNTCSSNDMFMNYMDYVDDACMVMFSQGQKSRMRAIFEPGGPRETFANGGVVTCDADACDNEISLSLTFDNYPGETSWALTDENGALVDEGNNYATKGQTINLNWSLSQGQYTFTIYDSYGDGICCAYGSGSYLLADGCNNTLQSGGAFSSSESVTFCVPDGEIPNNPPTAAANGPYSGTAGEPINFISSGSADSDGSIAGYQWDFGDGSTSTQANPTHIYSSEGEYTVTLVVTDNDGDTGSDVTSASISGSSGGGSVELSYDGFESGWGNWTDGGSDCSRYTSGTRAWEGQAAINIQDNSGISSSFYLTNGIDVASPGYDLIEIEFYFYAYSMESGEDFWVQYYDGSAWLTVASFARGIDFNNNTFYLATVSISENNYNFPSNMRIRFMCDASSNADDVYIDNVKISGSSGAAQRRLKKSITEITNHSRLMEEEISEDIRVYPNPAKDQLIVEVPVQDVSVAYVYSSAGTLIKQFELRADVSYLDISDLSNGLYLIRVASDDEIQIMKFIKE